MAKNPLIRKPPKITGKATGGHKSAGIFEDFTIRKSTHTREGTITKTPTADNDIANKKYVDDNAGAGDVTAGANLTDETLVQGDGGAKGVKTSTATVAQIADNVTKAHTAGTDPNDHTESHSVASHNDTTITGAETETLSDNSMADTLHRHSELSASDGTPDQALTVDTLGRVNITYDLIVDSNLLFVDVSPGYVGIGTATPGEMLDVVGNAEINGNIIVTGTVDGVDIAARDHNSVTLNASATTGGMSLSTQEISNRAATNAQTGYATAAHITAIEANATHVADNTQAHSDYLLNSGADIATGPLTITADNSSADQAYVPMILYNTDDTPPAASNYPIGTLYAQYTA